MRWTWWLLLLTACATAPASRDVPGDEIVACGRRFHTGTPVVLWDDPGGFDAYAGPEAHYGTRRGFPAGADVDHLRRVVTQVVVHYDVAVTSANCFRILHEKRGLSCHFLLDVDGTVYQTLDLKERAWHAAEANDRSIGIEIANIGAYRDPSELATWYDAGGALVLPAWLPRGELGPGPFRPARPGPIRGEVHGTALYQQDYTDAQYEALAKLLAALVIVFPEIRAEAPDTTTVLDDPAGFRGIVGHYHLTRNKVDPGPAFDWKRALDVARRVR